MKTIICIDRDGTLIHDTKEHLFLGRDNDWMENVQLLPYVADGIQLLNTLPDAGIYMITSQSGVAIADFPSLTTERAHEVCSYVVRLLKYRGASLDSYFLCPHVTPEYANRKPGVNFHSHLMHDCKCLKPALGMVFNALKAEGVRPDNADIYVIGDQVSDVQTAHNLDGTGILIPFQEEPGESAEVRGMERQDHIHVAENMLAAAEYIVSGIAKKRVDLA